MSEMGGLWRRMPWTFGTALVGAAALAGIPPFAGAFSKDGILSAAHERGGSLGTAVYVVGLVTAFVTAAYVTRLMLRTFAGESRRPESLPPVTPHESPLVMTAPLVVLATATVLLGLPVLPSSYGVERWFAAPAGSLPLEVGAAAVLLTTVIALAGGAVVFLLYRRRPADDPLTVLGRAAVPLRRAFWVDEVYAAGLVRPARAAARVVLDVDRRRIDATVVGAARGTSATGAALRWLQNGNVQAYLSGLVVGVLVVVAAVSVAVAI
jgi:NADH-quinone oxidoreductase subunit L